MIIFTGTYIYLTHLKEYTTFYPLHFCSATNSTYHILPDIQNENIT